MAVFSIGGSVFEVECFLSVSTQRCRVFVICRSKKENELKWGREEVELSIVKIKVRWAIRNQWPGR